MAKRKRRITTKVKTGPSFHRHLRTDRPLEVDFGNLFRYKGRLLSFLNKGKFVYFFFKIKTRQFPCESSRRRRRKCRRVYPLQSHSRAHVPAYTFPNDSDAPSYVPRGIGSRHCALSWYARLSVSRTCHCFGKCVFVGSVLEWPRYRGIRRQSRLSQIKRKRAEIMPRRSRKET